MIPDMSQLSLRGGGGGGGIGFGDAIWPEPRTFCDMEMCVECLVCA